MPERTANRLDVTFVPDQPPEARDRALRQIAGELLDVVWRRQGLPTVTVVERAPDGTEVNRVTTRLLGTAPPPLMGGTAD